MREGGPVKLKRVKPVEQRTRGLGLVDENAIETCRFRQRTQKGTGVGMNHVGIRRESGELLTYSLLYKFLNSGIQTATDDSLRGVGLDVRYQPAAAVA